ncbi:hypothetical protein ACFQT0_28385 [Hymenobacter humi]|uniref:Uncharacterized protein n=1 Tax=Hymenobacter humi TaxID=1411620 RepID=A0ABW2UFI8_9BACT
MSTTARPPEPQKTPPLVSGSTIALAWLLFSGFMVLLIFVQNLSAGTPTDWREALGGRLLHGLIWGCSRPWCLPWRPASTSPRAATGCGTCWPTRRPATSSPWPTASCTPP